MGYFTTLLYRCQPQRVYIDANPNENSDEDKSWKFWIGNFRKVAIWCTVLAVITWAGYVFIPSKRDCVAIVVGGGVLNYLSKDSAAQKIPHNALTFLNTYLEEKTSDLTAETKKEIGLPTPKEQFIDKLKDLTKEQILEALKKDTLK